MSSAGNLSGGAVSGAKSYFCYQCSRTVSISLRPSSEPSCPHCNDGFLEECENPSPQFHPPFPLQASSSPFSALLASSTLIDLQNPSLFSNPTAWPSPRSRATGFDEFDPFAFLQNRLHNMSADHGGAHIQFVIDNHPSDPAFRIPSNIGDYFVGPGLEQLIQHLADNDPNRYGTPPASRSAVQGLPTARIAGEHLGSEMNQCAVCQEEFEMGNEVKLLPCKHLYHQDCILPWLELHSSCPVCRHELPTDHPENERRANAASDESETGRGSAGRGGGGEGEGSERDGNVERTVRITFPWSFLGGFGSGSGSESGDSDGNNWGF